MKELIIDNLGILLRLLRKLAEWGCACSQNIMGGGRRCRPLAHSSRRRPFSSCPLGAPHSASVAPRNLLIIVRKNQRTKGASLCFCRIWAARLLTSPSRFPGVPCSLRYAPPAAPFQSLPRSAKGTHRPLSEC